MVMIEERELKRLLEEAFKSGWQACGEIVRAETQSAMFGANYTRLRTGFMTGCERIVNGNHGNSFSGVDDFLKKKNNNNE